MISLKHYSEKSQIWYEERDSREKILFICLVWAVVYAFFYYILFTPIDVESTLVNNQVKALNEQVDIWQKQIVLLNKMSKNPNYLSWLKQRKAMVLTQSEYKKLLRNSDGNQWEHVIKTILSTPTNVKVEQIKNLPETAYDPSISSGLTTRIFQQQLSLQISANYINSINYIIQLEKALPNLHWDSLHYEVTQYPLGKVDLEFSIFYEK